MVRTASIRGAGPILARDAPLVPGGTESTPQPSESSVGASMVCGPLSTFCNIECNLVSVACFDPFACSRKRTAWDAGPADALGLHFSGCRRRPMAGMFKGALLCVTWKPLLRVDFCMSDPDTHALTPAHPDDWGGQQKPPKTVFALNKNTKLMKQKTKYIQTKLEYKHIKLQKKTSVLSKKNIIAVYTIYMYETQKSTKTTVNMRILINFMMFTKQSRIVRNRSVECATHAQASALCLRNNVNTGCELVVDSAFLAAQPISQRMNFLGLVNCSLLAMVQRSVHACLYIIVAFRHR